MYCTMIFAIQCTVVWYIVYCTLIYTILSNTLHAIVILITMMTSVLSFLTIVTFCHVHNFIKDYPSLYSILEALNIKKAKFRHWIFFPYLFDFFILLGHSTRRSTALEWHLKLNSLSVCLSVCGFSLFSNPMLQIF